jgi:hypothetical protein
MEKKLVWKTWIQFLLKWTSKLGPTTLANKRQVWREALKIGNEHNRDKSESMQWNAENIGRFSDKSSWIKVNPNYKK